MNTLQQEIIRQAWEWKRLDCKETVENGGTCIDDLHRRFGAVRREPYCTKLAWLIINDACNALHITNQLPKTAGAKDLLEKSKKVLKVDTLPAVGAVFYRKSRSATATGHTGVVIELLPDGIRTIEGNNDDRIDFFDYKTASVTAAANGFAFIHTERMGGEELPQPSSSTPATGTTKKNDIPLLPIAAVILLAAAITIL